MVGGVRGRRTVDLQTPRSVPEILGATVTLYARYPALFIVLALAVVAPYELLVLAAVGSSPLGGQSGRASTALILILLDFALVQPLIAALYVHAVIMIGGGEQPRLLAVGSRVARVLPVVAAAQIVAGLGIGLGFVAFVVPGIVLLIRWVVVAQVAAIEHPDWIGALRRGAQLTRGNYLHIFGLLIVMAIVNVVLGEAAVGIAGRGTRAADVAFGIAVETLIRSFTALATAVLYFDLLARKAGAVSG
jgi:hypothetical protein